MNDHSVPTLSLNGSGGSAHPHAGSESRSHYQRLAVEMALDFVVMFGVMYTMVYSLKEVYININNFYMTGMMVTPMLAIMLINMRTMFPNKRLNLILISGSLVLFGILFTLERTQGFVGNKQFLRSMIPHHSGAILMCENAQISDPELKTLCGSIVTSQKQEIEQMSKILNRMPSSTPYETRFATASMALSPCPNRPIASLCLSSSLYGKKRTASP